MARITSQDVKRILDSGVFDNLESYSEFHKRLQKISPIDSQNKKVTQGNVFELFCEALMNVSNIFTEAINVWKVGYVPKSVLIKLNLPNEDRGYDGVYQTRTGYVVYQCKWRSNTNTKLNWNEPDHIASFVGISRDAENIHLFATCEEVVNDYKNSRNSVSTMINDFNTLDEPTLKNIELFLRKKVKRFKAKYTLDKYQVDATNDILKGLKKKSRVTAVMACGTGKSNIGVEVYKKIRPNLSIVFVPSLALIKQLRKDWIRQIDNDFDYTMYQFSSLKEKIPNIDSVKPLDVNINFNDSKDLLINWINLKIKHKIIFCTYQSSQKLSKYINKDYVVDFALYDEAHRTSSLSKEASSYFNYTLDDKNLFIKKRLFMTATRRISHKYKTTKDGDSIQTFSMDNEEVYGKKVVDMSFFQAARIGCIAKPKIIIQEIKSSDIEYKKLIKASTSINNADNPSERIAIQVAISRAVKDFNIKKFFSFHSSIKRAEIYTDDTTSSSGMKGFLNKDFFIGSVKGSESMIKRDMTMEDFKNAKYGYISNCRCLVEGVDVPEVEMVVYADPKRSGIDIVQSCGRALRNRNNSSKKFGYFLIPVFLNDSNDPSNNIENLGYERVVEFLQAIADYDDEIAEMITHTITGARGKGGGLKLDDIIINKNSIKLKKILENVRVSLSDKLETRWYKMIKLVNEFTTKHGNINLLSPSTREYKDLYEWLASVRRRWRAGDLSSFQVNELLKFGIKLDRDDVTKIEGDYFNLSQLSSDLNIEYLSLTKIFKRLNVKPLGKISGPGPDGLVPVYKKITREFIKKKTGIDYFEIPKSHQTISVIAQKFDIGRPQLRRYYKLKKQEGLTTIRSYLNNGLFKVYKIPSKNDVEDILGHKLKIDKKKFSNLHQLSEKFNIGPKSLKKLFKDLSIKGIKANGPSKQGILYYKNYSKKEFINLVKKFGVDGLEPPKDFISLHQLAINLNIGRTYLEKLLKTIGAKSYKYFGSGGNGKVIYYKNYSEAYIAKKLNVDVLNKPKGYQTIKELTEKYKIHNVAMQRLLNVHKIKSLKSHLYRNKVYCLPESMFKKIIKSLGIKFMKPPKGYKTIKQIASETNTDYPKAKKIIKDNNIPGVLCVGGPKLINNTIGATNCYKLNKKQLKLFIK